jgi:putative oligomerization/nucleic acid binding protein
MAKGIAMPRRLRRAAVVGGTAFVAHKAGERSAQRKADEEAAEPQQEAPTDPAPDAAEPEYMAELEQLAKLRDDGVITPEDFDAKKKQILAI